MRRLALCLAALALVAWGPDSFYPRDWSEAQALTRTAPTTDGTLGVSLAKAISFTIIIDAPANQTFSGAGEVDLYFWDTALAAWYPGPASSNWTTLAADCTGKARCSSGSFSVIQPRGRVMAVANGVTVSSGTTITTRILETISGKSTSY